jgi:hypothetical protein
VPHAIILAAGKQERCGLKAHLWQKNMETLPKKQTQSKKTWDIAQEVQHCPSKHEA